MKPIKLLIYFLLMSFIALTLTACDRTIPSPGKVYMPTAKDTFAENYLLGNSLFLRIHKASRCMKWLQHQDLRIDFLLGSQYSIYQLYKGRVLPSFNSGNYHYSIDYHEPHEGMLNLVSKGGWDILLSYQTRNSGTFSARIARGKCRSQMNGVFRIALSNPNYPN